MSETAPLSARTRFVDTPSIGEGSCGSASGIALAARDDCPCGGIVLPFRSRLSALVSLVRSSSDDNT